MSENPVGQEAIDLLKNAREQILSELSQVIVGQQDVVEQILISMFSRGHCLLEGVPGLAKTLMISTLSKTLNLSFSRIQFTPNLMPADITGTEIIEENKSTGARERRFMEGPVFSNIILADEINRTPPKTQAALFEVMEEQQVTVDGVTHSMTQPFFVVATQNPIEQEGTYKLPEAQLDRFLFKINVDYPELEDEKAILRRFRNDFGMTVRSEVAPVFTPEGIAECRKLVEQVQIREELLDYIAEVVHQTRGHADLFLGASPRASLAILKSSKAIAAMNGRDFVTPDDIRFVAYPVLNHRIILTPEREMEGYDGRDVVEDILKKIEVPR